MLNEDQACCEKLLIRKTSGKQRNSNMLEDNGVRNTFSTENPEETQGSLPLSFSMENREEHKGSLPLIVLCRQH